MRSFRLMALAAVLVVASACSFDQDVELRQGDRAANRGGTIVVGIGEPSSVDPANAFDASGQLVVETMCDSLLELDPSTGEIVPGLARSFNIDSATAITVTLHKGLRFSNGDKVSVDDVIFSLSRVAAEAAPGVADMLQPVVGYEFVHGDVVPEDPEDHAADRLIGVRRVSNESFQIALTKPVPDFAARLTLPFATIVPEDLGGASPRDFTQRPVCVGPYRLTDAWKRGAPSVRLERTPAHKPVTSAYTQGGAGYADAIELRVFADRTAQMAAYEAAEIDVASIPPGSASSARGRGADFVSVPTLFVEYVGLPLDPAVLTGDLDVRVALSEALDREAIVASVYGGGRLPAFSLLPPVSQLRTTGDGCERGGGRADLQGQRMTLYFNDELDHRGLMELVAQQWRDRLGLEVDLVGLPWDEYLATARSPQGFDGAFRGSWDLPYPSAQEYLEPLLSTASIGADNFSRASFRRFDRILERDLAVEVDPSARTIAIEKLERIACEQLPLIPLTYGAEEYLLRSESLGAAAPFTDPSSGRLILRELYIRSS